MQRFAPRASRRARERATFPRPSAARHACASGSLAARRLLEAVGQLAALGPQGGRAALVELEHAGALPAIERLGGAGGAGEAGGEEGAPHDPSRMHGPSVATPAARLA